MADCVYGGNKANIKPGYIRYVDVNHDGEINSKDRVILGNSTPRYEYSFTLGGQWKGIDLSLFFQGVIPELGQDLWFKTVRFSRASSIRGAPKTRMRNILFC